MWFISCLKVATLRGNIFQIRKRAKLLECNLRKCTYGITNAIIRTFILACANFSFVRPATSTSGFTQGSTELSFKRFIKLTRLIGCVHYSVDRVFPRTLSTKKHDPMGTLRNSALNPNDVNPLVSHQRMANEIIKTFVNFSEWDLKFESLKTQKIQSNSDCLSFFFIELLSYYSLVILSIYSTYFAIFIVHTFISDIFIYI